MDGFFRQKHNNITKLSNKRNEHVNWKIKKSLNINTNMNIVFLKQKITSVFLYNFE